MVLEIGRLCVKTAGRDSNKKCVIVDIADENFVVIDGQTRRRKCNIKHLEPLNTVVKIKKGASSQEVNAELKKLGIEVKKGLPKKPSAKPNKIRKGKEKAVKTEKKAEKVKPKKKEESAKSLEGVADAAVKGEPKKSSGKEKTAETFQAKKAEKTSKPAEKRA